MASWFSSWLPTLPTINVSLPSAIQRRFISFVLKKSLGHLLQPGQLDVEQIDSQIGSGYVQVTDLQLNDQAINELLSGLPVELVQGSLASVTARIPWPNPLSSIIGLSLDSLHLTFRVRASEPPPRANPNLAESVASMAESFIHDELTAREETTLRESFHSEFASSVLLEPEEEHSIPGGINPFISAPEEEDENDPLDPAGVSIFATLIERVLARFQFDATNTRVTLVHPDNCSLTANVDEIRYRASEGTTSDEGEIRTVSVSGLTLSMKDLTPAFLPCSTSPSQSPQSSRRSSSPASSSSSLDEETQLAMSQSLAFLPPRPVSPSGSVASSMYQSAFSEMPQSQQPERQSSPLPPSPTEATEAVLVAFGSEPISVSLITPPVSEVKDRPANDTELRLTVSVGVVACAIRARQAKALVELASLWAAPRPSSSDTSSSSLPQSFSAALTIKGIVCLALPPLDKPQAQAQLEQFFTHPISPPRLSQGYIRLHIDAVFATLSPVGADSTRRSSKHPSWVDFLSLAITEVSLFAVSPHSGHDAELIAYPVLITDPLLISQHDSVPNHPPFNTNVPQLPPFDVIDWTEPSLQPNGLRLSTWRTRGKAGKPYQSPQSKISSLPESTTAKRVSAVQICVKRKSRQSGDGTAIDVNLAPLHFFLDLDLILSNGHLSAFIGEISAMERPTDAEDDGADSTPPATPRPTYQDPVTQREMERRRLERMVIEDLDLALDYKTDETNPSHHPSGPAARQRRSSRKPSAPELKLTFNIPAIRLEARCPPLPSHNTARSGAVVVDLCGILLHIGSPDSSAQPSRARFAPTEPHPPLEFGKPLLSIQCQQIMLSYAPPNKLKAVPFLSIAPLAYDDASDPLLHDHPNAERHPPLQPRFTLSKTIRSYVTTAIEVALPSVYINLSKDGFDGLQYWADDVTQFLERTLGDKGDSSRDGSMIGSRYFATSTAGSDGNSSITVNRTESPKTEIVVKASVAEAFMRAMVPKPFEDAAVFHPFDIHASDLDIVLQIKPQGKDETVVTVAAMDLNVKETDPSGISIQLLSLSALRSLTASPQAPFKLQFASLTVPQTTSKESRIRLSLWGLTFNFSPNVDWVVNLGAFLKAPPGAFESVIPSEKTSLVVKLVNCSLQAVALHHPGAVVLHVGELEFSTSIVGDSPDAQLYLSIPSLSFLALDDLSDLLEGHSSSSVGVIFWKNKGFALVAEVTDLFLTFQNDVSGQSGILVNVERIGLRLHLCADTMSSIIPFFDDLSTTFKLPPGEQPVRPPRGPTLVSQELTGSQLMSSVDDLAFNRLPEVGPAPDMIYDDLPSNPDYLDESFSTTAGLRELTDEDLEAFPTEDAVRDDTSLTADDGLVSNVGGETIKMLQADDLNIVEYHFDQLQPISVDDNPDLGGTAFRLVIGNANVNVHLYDGYDWVKTRKTIEEEVKEMRKRLAKIRQLVASGQEPTFEETSAVLFNSVYIGLNQNADELEPGALIAAIDEELREDFETASQSSWQSLRPSSATGIAKAPKTRVHGKGKRLTRSKGSRMQFKLSGAKLEVDKYLPEASVVSRIFARVKDLEILDQIKTSTWDKFLTELRSDSRGDIRETDSYMVRVELRSVRPVPDHPSEEARLRAKILPLRLYVDQDALDFLKKFFSFKDPHAAVASETSTDTSSDIYFQIAEVFPVDLKLDYKPRRVDYRALREGRTIELMNFFHFDGAEMTLRHITLSGITGWPRLFDLLNDLWTPDVKATQLVDVISGVAPIRSVVNVGSGIADLVLLPIAQYKKDGRIVRGVQKGATAFVRSTATEAIKLGARLATGTQVILEQAEGVLGSQFRDPVTAETVQPVSYGDELLAGNGSDEEESSLISKYAEQPVDIREGVQSAYKSIRRNLNSAAQTILAVPMEVYERSGNEGPVRSVIRAVPIAVLKPMIGASEAVSKTLLGLHNTIDPNVRHDIEAKYKHHR